MKHIVSISIGSSKRNHRVEIDINDEKVIIERVGTDGDIQMAIKLVRELDGKVDAFGMGGIDVYLNAGKTRYKIKDALPIREAAKLTPMVDGSGLKTSLEKEIPNFIDNNVEKLKGKNVFILPGIDRYGMAEGFQNMGCELVLGDLMVALGINIPIKSLRMLDRIAGVIAPVACRLPFEMLYPTGKEQNKEINRMGRIDKFFYDADIIAGDFHYIRQYMPGGMQGRMVVTNTVTKEDIEWLKLCGIRTLVTSTPDLEGRSFGTNVIEALLVALIGKDAEEITHEDYLKVLKEINFKPRVEHFYDSEVSFVEKQG
ncbi:MAG: quinate 5-dehydrogenase [Clostridia bacterium BRH_c25]|nr:MAG: quinate 5-dehydrogenase [Clostridia bacterium BRH_c25]